MVSATTAQVRHESVTASMDNVYMNEHLCANKTLFTKEQWARFVK